MRYILVQNKKMQHPESDGFVSGKEALRSWWKDAFERLPSLNYKVKSLTANGDRVFMEYTRTVTGEVDLQVAEVPDIKENKIIASRVYHGKKN
jgi:predicted SnoaL-like aldol condensation-catalyzing enzyme